MLRTLFLRSLLTLTLLLVQQGAAMHTIVHTLAEQTQDHSLPHDQQCELCAAYAQVGSAVGSSEVRFEFSAQHVEALAQIAINSFPAAFTAFAARAPPCSA